MMDWTRRVLCGFAALAALALVAGTPVVGTAVAADTVSLSATLDGASEVPPKSVAGTGKAMITLDKSSKTLSWELSYSGLTGDAKAAHFHGPAAAGANAGVQIPLTVGPSPIKGSAQISDAQMADLLAGKWYVNIHTAANPGGEIRGQVTPAM
jgi:hypothetical protein